VLHIRLSVFHTVGIFSFFRASERRTLSAIIQYRLSVYIRSSVRNTRWVGHVLRLCMYKAIYLYKERLISTVKLCFWSRWATLWSVYKWCVQERTRKRLYLSCAVIVFHSVWKSNPNIQQCLEKWETIEYMHICRPSCNCVVLVNMRCNSLPISGLDCRLRPICLIACLFVCECELTQEVLLAISMKRGLPVIHCVRKKNPLTFSFISRWIICGFKQKLQWIYPRIDRFR